MSPCASRFLLSSSTYLIRTWRFSLFPKSSALNFTTFVSVSGVVVVGVVSIIFGEVVNLRTKNMVSGSVLTNRRLFVHVLDDGSHRECHDPG